MIEKVRIDMSPEEVRKLNEPFFERLMDSSKAAAAEAAVQDYMRARFGDGRCLHKTRSLSPLRNSFTGSLKNGILRRAVTVIPMMSVELWRRLGVSTSELVRWGEFMGSDVLYCWRYESGRDFVDMVEDKLEREDFDARLVWRVVPRWEWKMRSSIQRRRRRDVNTAEDAVSTIAFEQAGYRVFNNLMDLILRMSRQE